MKLDAIPMDLMNKVRLVTSTRGGIGDTVVTQGTIDRVEVL